MTSCASGQPSDIISGRVLDEDEPISGAVVRLQTTEFQTTTDTDGRFTLPDPGSDRSLFVTAWAPGYYIGGVEASPAGGEIDIHLEPHSETDNPEYDWSPSQYHPDQGKDQGCSECHSNQGSEIAFDLPVDEWSQDAHSQSAVNGRFLSMYNGTDVDENQSPPTRYGSSRDYGNFPLRPDSNQPYYGPGYKLDFPETAGNCATCHTPAASINNPYGVDPTAISGVPAEGVPCDFCHKIWDVLLDQNSGLPQANMPGVLSFEFRRPPDGHQFFAGPLDDVAPGEDTFSPLQQQSQFCAPCHFGTFWDTQIYNSFGEWLESPYSDPAGGQTCQDCHMPPQGVTHFALPEAGGLERDPSTIFSHRMPGASDEELLQKAVTMTVESRRVGNTVSVGVSITNDQTGHHVPTDSPLRQIILLVDVADSNGKVLEQTAGPRIPEYGGIGNSDEGYYADLPGKIFAKILMELWTEVSPTGAYWNPTRLVSDNRLAAFETDHSQYAFRAPESGEVNVGVRLIFRRAFIELMDQKGWDVPDILMEAQNLTLP